MGRTIKIKRKKPNIVKKAMNILPSRTTKPRADRKVLASFAGLVVTGLAIFGIRRRRSNKG